MVSMGIGGYVGTRVVLAKGDVWVRCAFVVFVVAIALKLLFW